MPQISVIVPVYNVEPYLRRCVDSILEQTFPDFELILVDDGSPDNCPAICDEYAQKDIRVHVIHQENGGLSAARNTGIDWAFANSDSQWLTFIDSDDWIHPEYLERLIRAALDAHVVVSICGYAKTQGQEPKMPADELRPRLWIPEEFFVEHNVNAIVAWGKLYRKECFEAIRYPVGKIHEDEFTTYKILFPLKEVTVIPAQMYYYFQNEMGIMRSEWTPKRMAGIEAAKEQMAYFYENGFDRAYRKAAFGLLSTITFNIAKIKKEGDSANLSYVSELRQMLRYEMKKDKHLLKLSLKTNYDLYEIAYPHAMRIYWLFIAVKNKVKKLLCRKAS